MSDVWSFYDPATGCLLGRTYAGPVEWLQANTPPGCAAIPGEHDPRRWCVHLVVDDFGHQQPVAMPWQPPEPPADEWRTWQWDTDAGQWLPVPTLAAIKRDARSAIDAAAGEARMRYVTEVPGQQAVYLRKLEQARVFAAAEGQGAPPAYIAAEALATGVAPLEAAQTILAIAQVWDEQLSPAIEALRIGGKRAVDAAADEATLRTVLQVTLAALAGI